MVRSRRGGYPLNSCLRKNESAQKKTSAIGTLANKRQSPRTLETQHKQVHDKPLTKSEMTTLQSLAQIFPALASNTIQPSNLRAISAKNNALRKNSRKTRSITPQVQHGSYLQQRERKRRSKKTQSDHLCKSRDCARERYKRTDAGDTICHGKGP